MRQKFRLAHKTNTFPFQCRRQKRQKPNDGKQPGGLLRPHASPPGRRDGRVDHGPKILQRRRRNPDNALRQDIQLRAGEARGQSQHAREAVAPDERLQFREQRHQHGARFAVRADQQRGLCRARSAGHIRDEHQELQFEPYAFGCEAWAVHVCE